MWVQNVVSEKNLNICGPLHVASYHGRPEIARISLERGEAAKMSIFRTIRAVACSPLHHASQHPFNDVSRLSPDHDASRNAPNNEGKTGLHVASLIGQNTVDKLLLEYST